MKRTFLISLLVACVIAMGAVPSTKAATSLPVWDIFSQGFTVGQVGSSAKWFYFSANNPTTGASFVGNDGITHTQHGTLLVYPTGTNPVTGLPAFALTLGQEQTNGGLPGALDHVKWLVYMNHVSSKGYPGFDAVPGKQLVCQSTVSGQVFGTASNPFGAAVSNPYDDVRLASFAMNVIDFETFMVFDVFFTDQHIYAFYEHLPFGRGPTLGDYAAFSYAIPIATRTPGDQHTVAVAYDKTAGVVRWYVDGTQRFSVDQIGYRLSSRQYMLLDHGGTQESFSPNQLDCGMGMFTLLDGYGPQNEGLVQLSSASNFYYNPSDGSSPENFFDTQSLQSNRIFGQGAALEVQKPSVGLVDSGSTL